MSGSTQIVAYEQQQCGQCRGRGSLGADGCVLCARVALSGAAVSILSSSATPADGTPAPPPDAAPPPSMLAAVAQLSDAELSPLFSPFSDADELPPLPDTLRLPEAEVLSALLAPVTEAALVHDASVTLLPLGDLAPGIAPLTPLPTELAPDVAPQTLPSQMTESSTLLAETVPVPLLPVTIPSTCPPPMLAAVGMPGAWNPIPGWTEAVGGSSAEPWGPMPGWREDAAESSTAEPVAEGAAEPVRSPQRSRSPASSSLSPAESSLPGPPRRLQPSQSALSSVSSYPDVYEAEVSPDLSDLPDRTSRSLSPYATSPEDALRKLQSQKVTRSQKRPADGVAASTRAAKRKAAKKEKRQQRRQVSIQKELYGHALPIVKQEPIDPDDMLANMVPPPTQDDRGRSPGHAIEVIVTGYTPSPPPEPEPEVAAPRPRALKRPPPPYVEIQMTAAATERARDDMLQDGSLLTRFFICHETEDLYPIVRGLEPKSLLRAEAAIRTYPTDWHPRYMSVRTGIPLQSTSKMIRMFDMIRSEQYLMLPYEEACQHCRNVGWFCLVDEFRINEGCSTCNTKKCGTFHYGKWTLKKKGRPKVEPIGVTPKQSPPFSPPTSDKKPLAQPPEERDPPEPSLFSPPAERASQEPSLYSPPEGRASPELSLYSPPAALPTASVEHRTTAAVAVAPIPVPVTPLGAHPIPGPPGPAQPPCPAMAPAAALVPSNEQPLPAVLNTGPSALAPQPSRPPNVSPMVGKTSVSALAPKTSMSPATRKKENSVKLNGVKRGMGSKNRPIVINSPSPPLPRAAMIRARRQTGDKLRPILIDVDDSPGTDYVPSTAVVPITAPAAAVSITARAAPDPFTEAAENLTARLLLALPTERVLLLAELVPDNAAAAPVLDELLGFLPYEHHGPVLLSLSKVRAGLEPWNAATAEYCDDLSKATPEDRLNTLDELVPEFVQELNPHSSKRRATHCVDNLLSFLPVSGQCAVIAALLAIFRGA
ncbi:hypothetical protein Q8F55_008135 [Vanrija albida]|uniref:Uncharacterized protein n=1 Tax=Vanrija albida TaxID=181172 RepID=A0ABR3PVG2_9TREE